MNEELNNQTKFAGKYRHFKGRFYDVYCIVRDILGEEYVLYRQCYADYSFWVRPYKMFFEIIELEDGSFVKRFEPTSRQRQFATVKIKALKELVSQNLFLAKNTESETLYTITSINEEEGEVVVQQIKEGYDSGYLTDYELMRRIGYYTVQINNETKYYKSKSHISDNEKFKIGQNNIEKLKNQINPCSVDLQIAKSGFLCAKRRVLDPQSIETISSAEQLWKPVHIKKSKHCSSGYFKLRPGNTVLTHTLERIKVPSDCAAKIEIKSTFARLSLSITSGDFCNPGYDGYFPLEITNHGKHTIIIHEGETMAQIILIPLQGPILEAYTNKATFVNEQGYDDGTPYTFWRERSIKAFRKGDGTQQIIDMYEKVLSIVNPDNTHDINEFRERFNNNFLPFCQKKLGRTKYKNKDTDLPNAVKLLNGFRKSERIKKTVFSIKWGSGFLTILSTVCSLIQLFSSRMKIKGVSSASFVSSLPLWVYILASVLFLGITIVLIIKTPKSFCTFENIDFDRIAAEIDRTDLK